MGTNKCDSFIYTYSNNAFNTLEMKDSNFTIIVLLFFLVCYLGNEKLNSHSKEVKYKNDIRLKADSLKTLRAKYLKLELYAIEVENICDKYKSSRDAKYHYHLKTK
jgi:hypothetical protein